MNKAYTIILVIFLTMLVVTVQAGTLEAFSDEGCVDVNGSTYLVGSNSSGDLVQLIWTGPDGKINEADDMGNATGDDVVIDSTYIGYGTLPGVSANGRFGKTFTHDLLAASYTVYIRTWNAPTITGLTDAYGNSPIRTMQSDIDHFNCGAVRCIERTSTPVELTSFTVNSEPGKMVLNWVTQSETENLGFYIYRSETIDGERVNVTESMISGAINAQSRNDYSWIDNGVEDGVVYYYWLVDVATTGETNFSDSQKAIGIAKPDHYELSQNYPNPFNPRTTIKYTLKDDGHVELAIFNIRGQLVRSLVSSEQSAGVYSMMWDAKDDNGVSLPSGIYFYRIRSNEFESIKKMSLTK